MDRKMGLCSANSCLCPLDIFVHHYHDQCRYWLYGHTTHTANTTPKGLVIIRVQVYKWCETQHSCINQRLPDLNPWCSCQGAQSNLWQDPNLCCNALNHKPKISDLQTPQQRWRNKQRTPIRYLLLVFPLSFAAIPPSLPHTFILYAKSQKLKCYQMGPYYMLQLGAC